MKPLNKRANILTENLVFIILNLVFLVILLLFVYSRMSDAAILEEKYAKQIALIIDASRPGMEISLNMGDAVKKANDKGWKEKIVSIQDNVVTVRLSEKSGGYSYSFFNDVDFNILYSYAKDGNDFVFEVLR